MKLNSSTKVEDLVSSPNIANAMLGAVPSEVFNEDCITVMKRYPDKFFDLAVVDPPYGLGDKLTQGGTWASKYAKGDASWDIAPPAEYWEQLFRVSKNQIVWGGNYFGLPASNCWLVWNKKNSENLYADCELAWTSFDSAVRMFEWRWHGFLQEKAGDAKQVRIHPTEKPYELYRWILLNYSAEGDLILDTHLGSGSIAVSCHYAGLDLTASEIDTEY